MRYASVSNSIISAMISITFCACDKQSDSASAGPAATIQHAAEAPAAEHAHAGAKPGSYEDWCGEHQVPESMCTRCNPSLVPAFKATGDWCAEHGLPESQCKICNPGLKIERPPRPEKATP
jgi:hypothetical protein